MSITERSEAAAEAIFAALQFTPSEEQARSVRELIDQALVNTTLEAGEQATQAAVACCSPDLDTAHKLAEEIRRRQGAVIANLTSMR